MEYGLVALWLVVYLALAALAAPAAAALLSRLPDRGAGFALPVALAVVGMVAFWAGRIHFGLATALAGLVVVAGLSGIARHHEAAPDWRQFGEVMAVFAVAFLFLVWIRALDPAVHPGGGEKFLDFGLLNSLLRSGSLPPEDMWFAGEPVEYYYGGHLLAALLSELTFTQPRYAYNLALAGGYATAVTAAYSLAGALADARGGSRRAGALLGAFFVGIASNLLTPVRALAWAIPGGADALASAGVDPGWATDGLAAFGYWDASRVIDGTVNEYPFFAYLNGDLHAHMLVVPFVLLLAATLFAYWHTPAGDLLRRRALALGVAPALVGFVAFVNTWSFPTALGLTWLVIALAPADPRDLLPLTGTRPDPRTAGHSPVRADGGDSTHEDRGEETDGTEVADDAGGTGAGESNADEAGPGEDAESSVEGTSGSGSPDVDPAAVLADEGGRVLAAFALVGATAIMAVLVVSPFLLGGTGSGRGIGIVEERSPPLGLLLVHGAFLAITVGYLLPRVDPGDDDERIRALALVGVLSALFWFVGLDGVLPFLAVVVAGWFLVRTDRAGYATTLAVAAAGVVVVVEFLYVTNAGPGRFNTVFKSYADVWTLWSVAAAGMAATAIDPARVRESVRSRTPDRSVAVAVGVALLVVSLSLYAGFALSDHAAGSDDPTLDAVEFVEQDHSAEAGAIAFVRDLEGQPTIVTDPAVSMYRWSTDVWVTREPTADEYEIRGGAAPASLTGVPTVAGWAHERGYRGDEPYLERAEDVRTIYSGTPGQQADLLAAYDVEYVYLGPAERQRYGDVDFAARLDGVEVAYDSEYVTIYEVDPGAVNASS